MPGRWMLIAVMGLAGAGELRAEDSVTLFGPTMGTAFQVKIAAPPRGLDAAEVQREIETYLADFDRWVSTYRSDSELSRFNAYRETEWFDVSEETARIVQQGLDLAKRSEGAFDPTVAPLVRLWGFDVRRPRTTLPSEAELEAARALVGYQRISVRLDPPGLRKSLPEMELDLNGSAPGYAADRIVERLASRGLTNVMVDVGGEIRVSGRKADGSSWRIGIERPATVGATGRRTILQAALPLDDAAVATSGDYRNFYELDGVRYSHTIDPRTGRPVQHGVASATVIAPDAATADGLATALLVLGPDEGVKLADRLEVAAWLLVRDASGEIHARASRLFREGVGQHLEVLAPAARPASSAPRQQD